MERKVKPVIRASIFVIMLFQFAALFSRQFLNRGLVGSGFDTTTAKHLSYLVVPVILLVLMWPILVQNKVSLRRLFRRPKSWPEMILAAIALGFVLRVARWSCLFALTSFGFLDTAEPGRGTDFSYYFVCPPINLLVLSVFVMSILTPLTEEIVNRGLILGSMSLRDPRVAVIISALLFAVLHRPSGIPSAFVFGLFAGAQLLRYRTLWAPLIAHSTYNMLGTFDWGCLHVSWIPEESAETPVFFGTGMVFVALTSIVAAIWLVILIKPGAD